MTQPKNIALLCNPVLEKSLRVADEIMAQLRRKEISHAVFTTYWPTVWDGFTDAWIVGGDGTLHVFINKYPGFELSLALFAGGSGNDLHGTLYGDITVAAQVEKVLETQPRYIDAGTCNGTLFLNGLGFGFDGMVVKSMLGRKKLAGKASYLLSIMKHIFLYRERSCTITCNDAVPFTTECLMISVANGKRYGGGFQVAPNADVTDGLLDLVVVAKIDAAQRLRYLPVIERGEHLQLPFVQYRQTGRVQVSCATPLHAHLDGEYLSADTFDVRCLENAFLFLW
jgi:YegS/Rv2252/BmrU family lipid kinase